MKKARLPKASMCLVCDRPCGDSVGIHNRCALRGSQWLTMIRLYLGLQKAMKTSGLNPDIKWKSRVGR